MSLWISIASIFEVLPDNHPILIEREQENSQVNLFTDIFEEGLEEKKEKILYDILKELQSDGVVGGFTPRVRVSEPHMDRPFIQHRINFYNNYIRSLNNEDTMGKVGAITIFILWSIFWLGAIPYSIWRLTQMGWPFTGG